MKYIYLIIVIILLNSIAAETDNKKTNIIKLLGYFKEMNKIIDKDSAFKKNIQLKHNDSYSI